MLLALNLTPFLCEGEVQMAMLRLDQVRNNEVLVNSSKWKSIIDLLDRRKKEILHENLANTSRVELSPQLHERRNRELVQIVYAIERIARNEYGECELCNDEISITILQCYPYTRMCHVCRTQL